MVENKLKTAILGLDGPDRTLLNAAAKMASYNIQAVADKDSTLAEKVAAELSCEHYDDYRQLVIQNQFDCLLVAAPLHTCDEHLRTAMKKKFNVLKLPPLAQDFEQALELVRLAEEQNVKFAVANQFRCAQSFRELKKFLQPSYIEKIFLITALCTASPDQPQPWQCDQKLAGGGVLLHQCYQLIDQIVSIFAVPQQVYCLATNTAADRKQRQYLTEDTSVLAVRFSEAVSGNIITSKVFGPPQQILKVYGKDKTLTVTDAEFTVSDQSGHVTEHFQYHDNNLLRTTEMLNNFALSILSPDQHKLYSSASENLKNMAVIEAAYLSARTAMPEQPLRIFQKAHPQPTGI